MDKLRVLRSIKEPLSGLQLHFALYSTAQNTWHLKTFLKNGLFPTTGAREWQHVEAEGGRTFFGELINTFVFDIFKIHRGGALYPLAPSWQRTC